MDVPFLFDNIVFSVVGNNGKDTVFGGIAISAAHASTEHSTDTIVDRKAITDELTVAVYEACMGDVIRDIKAVKEQIDAIPKDTPTENATEAMTELLSAVLNKYELTPKRLLSFVPTPKDIE